jgi:hypothetical protein
MNGLFDQMVEKGKFKREKQQNYLRPNPRWVG